MNRVGYEGLSSGRSSRDIYGPIKIGAINDYVCGSCTWRLRNNSAWSPEISAPATPTPANEFGLRLLHRLCIHLRFRIIFILGNGIHTKCSRGNRNRRADLRRCASRRLFIIADRNRRRGKVANTRWVTQIRFPVWSNRGDAVTSSTRNDENWIDDTFRDDLITHRGT